MSWDSGPTAAAHHGGASWFPNFLVPGLLLRWKLRMGIELTTEEAVLGDRHWLGTVAEP